MSSTTTTTTTAASSARRRVRAGWTALQDRLSQTVETVTRTVRIDTAGVGVDEIDPPEDLDEYWDQYESTGIVRSNVNQFVSDVVEPGARVRAEDDATEDYFMGGDAAPADAPANGFLDACFVHAGERHQPFLPGLKSTIKNRWVRGTALIEQLKADRTDAESPITGFYLIQPETVHPQVEALRNILLPPDPADLPEGIDETDVELTPRDEVAAYIQFDDRSIIGRRTGFSDKTAVPLSQNDVMKQVLDPDIGGEETNEQGVFGTSIMAAISEDVTEYKQTKRDRFRAIQTKAYGVWLAQFNKEVYELGPNEVEIVEWTQTDQDDWVNELDGLDPGEIATADGEIDLKRFDSDVPDLEGTLGHYVDDITAPLPAPKYSVGFEQDINQFVTERQETRYDRLVDEERRYQERKWTAAFRTVASRHPDLDPEGLELLIEPEEEDSPVRSLTSEEIEQVKTYAEALDLLAGPTAGPGTLVDDEVLRDLVAQLPEDAGPPAEQPVDETDDDVADQFDQQFGGADEGPEEDEGGDGQ